jgi:RHS repeat-associated protein
MARFGSKLRLPSASLSAVLLILALSAFSPRVHAQSLPPTTPDDQMGMMPYVSYHGGDIDTVNLGTGNLVVRMPFLTYPQRGNALRAEFDLQYNGKPYQYQCEIPIQGKCSWQWWPSGFSPGWGPSMPPSPTLGVNVVDADAVTVAYSTSTISHPPDAPDYTDLYKVMTADNASHLLGLIVNTGGNCASGPSWYYSAWGTFMTLDATGWQMQVPSCGSGATIISPTGVSYKNNARQDPNGNYVSITMGCPYQPSCSIEAPLTLTDTLGRQIPIPPTAQATGNASTSLCPTGPLPAAFAVYWTPPGYNGATLQYLFCYANVPINIPPYASAPALTGAATMLQSITLPNGTAWTFAYQDSSGLYNGQQTNYGDLTQITLPTGGTIQYAYGWWSSVNDIQSRWVSSRTVNANDGTGSHQWTYSYGYNGSTPQTIVTDPLGNDAVHTFGLNELYETSTQYYQGSHTSGTLLKTVATTYQYSTNLNAFGSLAGVVPIQITTTWASNNEVIQVNKAYDSGFTYIPYYPALGQGTSVYGKVTSETDYDYGSGAKGLPLRTTNTSYAWQSPNPNYASYLSNNLLNLVYSVRVEDGGGTQRAYAYHGYDESTPQSSGISEQKTTGESYPGNQTSVHRWLNGSTTGTTNCNAITNGYLITTKAYYDTGEVPTVTDPCGYQTNYQYSSTYYGAFVTKVTNALGQNMSYGYDFTTGAATSITDWNSQITTKNYDMLTRLTSASYPDGGSTTLCYSDTLTSLGGTCQSGPPFQVIVTKAITSSLNETSTIVFDGLGRTSQTQLTSDPSGTTYTQTTYDALGRKSQVYNPTRCSPPTTNCGAETTWGYTTTNYDPLSRITSVVEQDGSTVSTNYSAFPCTTVTDEAGNSRQSCADGLGRMTSVLEDPGSSPHLNYQTRYQYDALSNLTNVTQNGSNSAYARTRAFVYDSLSELTSAANPESGTILYGYDGDGNVVTKTAPLPNQAGTATVTTTNTYDKLNRPTSKSYLDGNNPDPYTPTVQFGYDAVALTGCTTNPPNLTDSYPIGRRTAMCDGSGATSWVHDKMGRVLQERRTLGAVVGDYETDAYNLDGSPQNVTSLGFRIAYTYSGAARALTATNNATNPVTKFVSSGTYAPPGELAGATLGSVSGGFAGFTVANAYNDRLQPILLSAATPTATVFSECFDFHLGVVVNTSPCSFSAYSTGDNGNVYQIVNNRSSARNDSFAYDSLNRIGSAQSNGSQWGETFTIDAWGNLTNRAGISGKTYYEPLACPANTNNQLTTCSQVYDAAGNMTSNGSASYVYDAEDRLIATAGYSYIYDANGQRVEKCTEGSTPGTCASGATGTLYWRGLSSDPLTETNLAGTVQNNYVFFNGQRVARSDSTPLIHYYFSDHLGSHGVVENATGTTCEQDIDYYPYGGVENDYCPNVAQNYKFTGKERDSESGLDYFGARHYGSSLGRFLQADPFTVTPGRIVDPQQFNLYAYVRNNPLRHIDPTGMLIDDSQLSDKDKKKWQQVQNVANQKDQNGNYLHPELQKITSSLQSDSRTFVLQNSKLDAGTAGVFTITNMTADGKDFTKATLQLDFKQIQGISSVTGADLVPGFNKYQGLLNAPMDRLAETFGHEGAHGLFSIENPAQAVGIQQLLNQRDAAMQGQHYPYPPDVMQKMDAADKGLIPTERFAQQEEKIINGELQADKKKQ